MDSIYMAGGDEFVSFDGFTESPFHDNLDGSFNGHMEFPDGSVPTIAKASSGRMSPVRAKTVKEFYEQLSELKKENFSLKLRIFYMEERMNSNKEFTKDEYSTANINLKIEVESLKKELGDKAELLKKASNAMDHLSVQHQEELDAIQRTKEQERQQMTEMIRKDFETRQAEMVAGKDRTIEQLSRELDRFRTNVEKLEKEKQDTLNELNQRVAQLQNQLADPEKTTNEQEKMDLLEIIEEQRQKTSELEVVLDQLSEELTQKDNVIETLEKDGREMKDRYSEMKKKLKRAEKGETSFKEKDSQVKTMEKTIVELRKSLEQRDKRCKELENHSKQLGDHISKLESELAELKATIGRNENDLLVRAKAIQGLTQEAHVRGKENEQLCDRIEELERQLTDASADLHTHKMSKYDQESSTQKDLLEAENYVQKLQAQVGKLQQDLRKLQAALAEKDAKISELESNLELVQIHAQELENFSSEQQSEMASKLAAKDEGVKHLVDKFENEKLAIRQQIRVLQGENQRKDQHLRLMYDLRGKVDRLLQVTESKHNDSAIEKLRDEIRGLRDRLPASLSPSKDSPMAFSAHAPMSTAHENQRQFQDPHMSLAGPMVASTPNTPPQRDAPPPRDSAHRTPVYPSEETLRQAPPLRPALVGSANPDLDNDVTEYRPLAEMGGNASFEERLQRLSTAQLRNEVVQVTMQLRNAKDHCSQLQRRVDELIEDQLLNVQDRQRQSPNRASDIIKRLKCELENSKSRLQELERLNSVLMQSDDMSTNQLKAELIANAERMQNQSQMLSEKQSKLTQITILLDRVCQDLHTLDTQFGQIQANSASWSEGNETHELQCHVQSQVGELRRRLQDRMTELEQMSRSPTASRSLTTPAQDLDWDSRDLFHENQILREKLGLSQEDDYHTAPSMCDVTKRLVEMTEQLNRMQSPADETKNDENHTREVDRLCDEIIALRQENDRLAKRYETSDLPAIATPSRVSDDLLSRHQRQIETLRSELNSERQQNRSLMDVINSRTPDASFRTAAPGNQAESLRRLAVSNTTSRFDDVGNSGDADSTNVVERLDDVCRLLNEILSKQDDLSDHVLMSTRGGDGAQGTAEYLGELKRKLSTMVSLVQSVAVTMDESVTKDATMTADSSLLRKTREQCTHAQENCARLEDRCSELECKYSAAEERAENAERKAENAERKAEVAEERAESAEYKVSLSEQRADHAEQQLADSDEQCDDLRQMHRLSEQKCSELEQKCAHLNKKFKDVMAMREGEMQRLDELETDLEELRKQNDALKDDLVKGKQMESELQNRVRELEDELCRSMDDNQTLRNDVIVTQDLLNQTKQGLNKKTDDNMKLKAKLQKNDETIKQCTESLTSVRAMVKEKNEMIRLLKEKCRRLQRSRPRGQNSVSTASEEDDDPTNKAQRPHRRRKSRSSKPTSTNVTVAASDGRDVAYIDRPPTERLRHYTGGSSGTCRSIADGGEVLTASEKSPSPCANIPLPSDHSESAFDYQMNLDTRSPSPIDELERLKHRLRTTENMNETLKAELMLYQHLSQTLTSSAGSTPVHQSKTENMAPKIENVSLHECSIGSWTNISPTKRPASAPKRLSEGFKEDQMERSASMSVLPSELAQHLLELRRLRERLEETIALNDDLTRQLNEQLKERNEADHQHAPRHDDLVESLRHQNEALSQDLAETQTQLNYITEEAESFRNEAEKASLECQNLSTQIRRHAQESELLREDSNRLTQDNNRLRADQKTLKDESNKLKEANNRLESDRARLQEKYSRLKSECEKLKSGKGGDKMDSKVRDEIVKMRGNGDLDLSQLVEEIARLRIQLERSINTNQALRNKLEEIIERGGSDSLSSSLKKLLKQSDPSQDPQEPSRAHQSARMREVVDHAYQYPPDSSDSGTCTGNRSLSNSHSSLPPMRRNSRDDIVHGQRLVQSAQKDPFPNLRRAVSALSLTESVASSRGTDVIQHCDVINDDEHILSVSMLEEEEQRRRAMPDFDLETRDDYLLLPPGGRGSLHAFQARPQGGMLGTRSVDDLRHIGGGQSARGHSYDRKHHSTMRVNSDIRFLFAIGRLDDYELAKKQLGECQILLRGVAARVQDRLQAYHGSSLVQSADYTTLREVSTSIDNMLYCVQQASGLLYQFWTSQLPPRDHHGNYVDLEMQRENDELRLEIRHLKNKYSHALQTMKSAQKRLHKANKRKEDMEEAIYRQLSQTEKVVRQARINMEVKTGVSAADVLARRTTDA